MTQYDAVIIKFWFILLVGSAIDADGVTPESMNRFVVSLVSRVGKFAVSSDLLCEGIAAKVVPGVSGYV